MISAMRINDKDSVAVLPVKTLKGDEVIIAGTTEKYVALEDIPAGHKIAIKAMKAGEYAIKYGIPIGILKTDCPVGAWVHDHNLIDNTEEICTGYCKEFINGTGANTEKVEVEKRTIKAFPRKDGSFGIRNYVYIFATSLEANNLAEDLSNNTSAMWWACDNRTLVDGTINATIQYQLEKLAGNPNLYSVIILGSEKDRAMNEKFVADIKATYKKDAVFFPVSEETFDQSYRDAFKAIQGWEAEIAGLKREEIPFDGFTMSIHCGGSDWTTALYGNPALGVASDWIVNHGGYVIMDEWAGLPGSEHLLAGHAANHELGVDIINRVQKVRDKVFADTGKKVEEINPFPSNKEGGITTLVEKSTGNIKKAGSRPIQAVLKPGDRPTVPGVYLQDQSSLTPYSTGMFAGLCGCHINVFVCGVGYVYYELNYMPVIRTTGNPTTFAVKEYKFDFNSGAALEGTPLQEVGKNLFDYIVSVAEGVEPLSEINKAKGISFYNDDDEYYQNEFCRYKGHRRYIAERIEKIRK